MTMTEDRFITYEEAREIFATKADIAEVRTDVAELRAEVRGDVAEMETRIIKWMVAVQIGGITAMAAVATAIIAISRLLVG